MEEEETKQKRKRKEEKEEETETEKACPMNTNIFFPNRLYVASRSIPVYINCK